MSDHVRQSARLGGSWHYRCAAHEYRLTAAGHYHPLFFNRLMPWDHAPGWLPHQEAGGLIRPSDPHDGAHRHGDCFAPLAMTAKESGEPRGDLPAHGPDELFVTRTRPACAAKCVSW